MTFLPDFIMLGGVAAIGVGLYLVVGLGFALIVVGLAAALAGYALDNRRRPSKKDGSP